jgi:adenine-specific DNA-methyltransferase
MENLLENLKTLLQKDERLVDDKGEPLKNKIIELALKLDKDLIKLLLSDKKMEEVFFVDVDGTLVFNKDKFIKFVSNKQFLPDSYTAFKNKIGLIDEKGEFISEEKEVVLSWPYKDCVLEGGMTKEDQKRDEIFWNEILAPDEIARLLDPKVFTNAKRIDAKGERKLDKFRTDENGNIKDNLIIKGNNLLTLHSLKKRFAGRVKLIYIDPPFNTGSDTFTYNDRFSSSTWLTFMKNRLEVAKDLLDKDGNIFVHIDDNQCFELKVLMDEIFKKENFVETIIWAYGSPSGGRAAGAKLVGIHDYILHYAKNYNQRKQFKIYTPYSDKYLKDWFKYKDEKGRIYRRRMRGRDEKGNIIWEKQYLEESPGVPGCTVWTDIKQIYADPRAFKIEQRKHTEMVDYDTQKPEMLLKRIIEYSTSEGDLVLDFFNGSGTTTAVAHKMKRQWIGVEQLEHGAETFFKRMKKILHGDQTGISKEVNWQGGGDFVYLELMNWNENFVDEIKKAKSGKELHKLWETMKEKAHLSYKVDLAAFDKAAKDFADLSLENQKRFLRECLDNNHLYVNYSEIDDEEYGVSEEDKKLNREFYKI